MICQLSSGLLVAPGGSAQAGSQESIILYLGPAWGARPLNSSLALPLDGTQCKARPLTGSLEWKPNNSFL